MFTSFTDGYLYDVNSNENSSTVSCASCKGVMRHCSASGTEEKEMRAWKLQFMFGKCVLRQQPEIRGGKKKKVKRNETLRTGLMDRLTR